jgi:lipoprotein-anchoring transpeptidase ErfK/SrfK
VKNGGETIVEAEGKEGLAVDIDQAVSTTATNLNSGKPVSMELRTYAVKFKTQVNNIYVADWSKYIVINISTQTMCAYLAGGVQVNCWAVTTGQNGWNTPVGTFLIQRKSGEGGQPGSSGGGVCMPNPPSAYPLCGINYVSTFTPQGHAIHEAWWRTSFGTQAYKYNGSHGCINATYDIAKFIFYWAPIGTPVITHY